MTVKSFSEVLESSHEICKKCNDILMHNSGKIPINGFDTLFEVRPKMWKHSVRDKYHACIYVDYQHIFLCGTDEFDTVTLERIRPLKKENSNTWSISINGKMYHVSEINSDTYEILYDDGTIVKDEEVEAKIFNHMIKLKYQ